MHLVYTALAPFGSWLALGIIAAVARSRISRTLNHRVTTPKPPDQHTVGDTRAREPQAAPR